MIKLTRLSGKPFALNAERILYVEETPDTIVTLENKERILVKESADDVIARVIEYQRQVRSFAALAQ